MSCIKNATTCHETLNLSHHLSEPECSFLKKSWCPSCDFNHYLFLLQTRSVITRCHSCHTGPSPVFPSSPHVFVPSPDSLLWPLSPNLLLLKLVHKNVSSKGQVPHLFLSLLWPQCPEQCLVPCGYLCWLILCVCLARLWCSVVCSNTTLEFAVKVFFR